MQELIRHLVDPLASHPEDISCQLVDGEAAIILEVKMNQADADTLQNDDGRLLRAVRTVLSAAAGRRKVTMDIVQEFADYSEE